MSIEGCGYLPSSSYQLKEIQCRDQASICFQLVSKVGQVSKFCSFLLLVKIDRVYF